MEEERDIKNKIIVVTGGADGIGFQITRYFLKAEAKLAILLDINENKGYKSVEKLTIEFGPNKVVFIKCDVVKDLEQTYQKIKEDFGAVDVLINSAGAAGEGVTENCLDVNFIATVKWSLKFKEFMGIDSNGNGGTIINISSIFGYRTSYFAPIYVASKFGVVGFTKVLGHKINYGKSKVRVFAICPGFTRTGLTQDVQDGGTKVFDEINEKYQWQSAEKVGENTVEIFKTADSGTLWEIEGGALREVILNRFT